MVNQDPKTVNTDYKILYQIGSGSFGSVWIATHKKTNLDYAIKIENKTKKSRLKYEYNIYKNLISNKVQNIPIIKEYFETDKNYFLVMQLLGHSLDQLFSINNRFDVNTIFKLAISITSLLENIHNAGYIHRDIKPNNFILSLNNNQELYIMDFGLSKKYINDNKHIKFIKDKSLVGTARYASLNIHNGFEPSRRDDLEAVGYMLVYFAKGKLPWQGLKKRKDLELSGVIGEYKSRITLEELCVNLPDCFEKYIKYCRDLQFEQTPDYQYLKNLFINVSITNQIILKYNWN